MDKLFETANDLVGMLNKGQRSAYDNIIEQIKKRNGALVQLIGYAGTGKTFLINRIVEALVDRGFRFGMTAPTHKAVRVLRKKSENADRYLFGTIHSFLGLEQKVNTQTGEVYYETAFDQHKDRKIQEVNVLIVDEGSMLDRKLFTYIMDYHMQVLPKLAIIFVGDNIQMPPVNEKPPVGEVPGSLCLRPETAKKYEMHTETLEQIMRQADGNDIIDYATYLRENWRKPVINFPLEGYKCIQQIPRTGPDVFPLLEELFACQAFEDDPDYAKVVSYRNNTTHFFNDAIRKLIFKQEDLPKIIVGDKLVADAPITEPGKSSSARTIIVNKSEEMFVSEVRELKRVYSVEFRPGSMSDDVELRSYQATVQVDNIAGGFRTRYINILHESEHSHYESIMKRLKAIALGAVGGARGRAWREFYSFEANFAQVNHNYAITTHKSQGSSYTYCISHEWDMEICKRTEERNSLKYVAATRPTDKLYVVR